MPENNENSRSPIAAYKVGKYGGSSCLSSYMSHIYHATSPWRTVPLIARKVAASLTEKSPASSAAHLRPSSLLSNNIKVAIRVRHAIEASKITLRIEIFQ